MTASRILRSRLDSSCEAISANLGTTSNHCQVGRETIEAQPTQRREPEPITVGNRAPSSLHPRLDTNKFRTRETQPVHCAQPQIHALGGAAPFVEDFRPFDWILRARQTSRPLHIRVD